MKFFTNPCNKCLVKPICREKCDLFDLYSRKQNNIDKFIRDAIILGFLVLLCTALGAKFAKGMGWIQ